MEKLKELNKRTIYKNNEIRNIVIDESFIQGIIWKNDGKDIQMIIDWNGQKNLEDKFDFLKIKTKIMFEFVTDFQIKIDFGEYIGEMEITSFSFKEKEDIREVFFSFNFIPKGFIKFKCNDLYFIIEE